MAGSIETKAISASNLKLKLKLTEAELGNNIYRAFERMRGKYEPELILPGLGFTQRQLFWLSKARAWCKVQRPDTLRFMVSNNIYTYTRCQ